MSYAFNKPIRQFFLVICLLSFFTTSLLHPQTPVVYPLHVGDYWQYSFNTLQFTNKVIKDTLMSNGLNYSEMISTGFNPLLFMTFQRTQGDSVFQYYHGQDALFYDFSLSPGDTTTVINGTDTLDITLLWTGTVTIFGRERRQWRFFVDKRQVFDEEEAHWITDSLGLTTWWDGLYGVSFTLQGAIINGIQYGNISGLEKEKVLSYEYKLFQNYPNPFNASTQIRFTIPKSAFVCLKIYDVLGREIATLVSERLNAGDHTYNWDTGKLSSGVYYYYLKTDNFGEVKKMAVMK